MNRVGVDIGGTFTDLVVYEEGTGRVVTAKTPTTPEAPEDGLLQACRQADIDMKQVSNFMHGTTLVTNLILTRTGAKVGLITTKGFRDVLEIGKSYRKELFDLQHDRPNPFVPRYLVYEVAERMDHKGNVLVPLDREQVASVVRKLLAQGVEAIAVSLFNSYANADHEGTVGRVIRELAPEICISLSSEVDPRIREYERMSTTVLNAYAMPRTQGYIERLSEALGMRVKYMHSGAGVIPSTEAQKFPVNLVASGPAAGVLAAKFIGQRTGIRNIIAIDVGGTSFDVCVIRDGQPDSKDQVEIEWGIPARTQSIDVNSIGAGGGSIAWIDEGGALKVGPHSAGASPGPACYNLGGTQPTVTDANLVLGILNPENFLGGKLRVAPEKSREAIKPIADHFNCSIEEAALGIYRIVNASMVQAILAATVRKGIDPRDFTLVPYGGAGGQHAVELARDVGIPSILVPLHSGTFSAFGLLTADLKNTVSRTVMLPLDELAIEELSGVFKELENKGGQFLQGEEDFITRRKAQYILDVRYIGQSNEVAVPLEGKNALNRDVIYREFEGWHHVLYGTQLGDPAEIVNARLTVTGLVSPLKLRRRGGKPASRKLKPKDYRHVALYDKEIAVFDRHDLYYGMTLRQPCIIEEVDSTFLMPEGNVARIDQYGDILVQLPKKEWR